MLIVLSHQKQTHNRQCQFLLPFSSSASSLFSLFTSRHEVLPIVQFIAFFSSSVCLWRAFRNFNFVTCLRECVCLRAYASVFHSCVSVVVCKLRARETLSEKHMCCWIVLSFETMQFATVVYILAFSFDFEFRLFSLIASQNAQLQSKTKLINAKTSVVLCRLTRFKKDLSNWNSMLIRSSFAMSNLNNFLVDFCVHILFILFLKWTKNL